MERKENDFWGFKEEDLEEKLFPSMVWAREFLEKGRNFRWPSDWKELGIEPLRLVRCVFLMASFPPPPEKGNFPLSCRLSSERVEELLGLIREKIPYCGGLTEKDVERILGSLGFQKDPGGEEFKAVFFKQELKEVFLRIMALYSYPPK